MPRDWRQPHHIISFIKWPNSILKAVRFIAPSTFFGRLKLYASHDEKTSNGWPKFICGHVAPIYFCANFVFSYGGHIREEVEELWKLNHRQEEWREDTIHYYSVIIAVIPSVGMQSCRGLGLGMQSALPVQNCTELEEKRQGKEVCSEIGKWGMGQKKRLFLASVSRLASTCAV